MNTIMSPEILELMESLHYRPAISIIMPLEPKMNLKTEITHSLKIAADKVEYELLKNYPHEMSMLVMQKLRTIIKNLNFNAHKKSIAIYLSPVFEKVLYLDIAVEERITVDESFKIRDLLYSKKQLHKYLVLLLSSKESRIYLYNSTRLERIFFVIPESFYAYENEAPEKVGNFSDISQRKEMLMEKLLHYIDNSLDIILKAYQLPLFILAAERTLGHFKKLTKHTGAIIGYVQGNYEEATLKHLKEILEPQIADWEKVKQKDLLNLLENAAGKKKLAVGMSEVWHEAMNHKGRLLVIEKNYAYDAEHEGSEDVVYKTIWPYSKFSYNKNAVDDVIEKVLENGGDVEFVDKDVLTDYHKIALVRYY